MNETEVDAAGVWDVQEVVRLMREVFRLPGVGSQYVAILSPTVAELMTGKRPGKGIGWRRYRKALRRKQVQDARERERYRMHYRAHWVVPTKKYWTQIDNLVACGKSRTTNRITGEEHEALEHARFLAELDER